MKHLRASTALLLTLVALASGCTAPRSGSGPITPCALALPIARTAVHGHGRLLRVETQNTQHTKHLLGTLRIARQRECVITYRGPYTRGEVTRAGERSGRYAIIIVRVHPPRLLRATVVNVLPRPGRKRP